MIPTFRVSHVAAFARWREDEDSDVGWLINQIRSNEETEPMRKGTAFHKALETIKDGWEGTEIQVDGYRFVFTCDVTISLPQTRETRKGKDYGGIIVSGQADGLGGRAIIDHKTTAHFDAEKYLEGQQWRFYLDLFDADRFDWYVWEMKEIGDEGSHAYEVFGFHQLTQYRYPELESDCRELVLDFKRFADRYLQGYNFNPTECVHAPLNGENVDWKEHNALHYPEPGGHKELPKTEWKMFATRGHNLIAVGWTAGVLRCAFAGKDGARFGRYSGVPEAEFAKLKNSPYPDRLFASNVKTKYEYQREA